MSMRQSEPRRLKDLLRLLESIRALHKTLEGVIRLKLEAMRRADLSAMQTALERERVLTERLREREGLRRQLMDAIAKEMGLTGEPGRMLTVTGLAKGLKASSRRALWACADALSGALARTAQANRVAAVTTRALINHMQWVFGSVRPAGGSSGVYSVRGTEVPSGGTILLETVG